MADTVIKSYVWWILGGLLCAVIALGGYYVWSQPPKSHIEKDSQSEASDNAIAASPFDISAVDSSLALFSYHLTPGHIIHTPLIKDGRLAFSSTAAKTGEASLMGKALSDGLFLYMNKINSQFGGLGGKIPLSLDQRDDSGRLLNGVRHISKLLEESSLFLSPMGDVMLEKAYLPLLRADKAALFFPIAGIRPVIKTPKPLVFFRPSYAQEMAALVHYAINILKQSKIAVFYEESSWGRMGREAVERLLARHNLSLCSAASYQPGSVNVSVALNHMQKAEPHVVICVASGRPAYNFIREAVNKQLHYVSFLGVSGLAGIAEHLRKSRGINLVTSSVVPNPHNSQLPIVQEYRKDMQQYLPNKGLSTYSLEGYINSALMIHFLQQLPTHATVGQLWQVIRQTRNLIFKGLSLDFYNSALSQTIWINEGSKNKWHEYVVRDA